MTSGVSGGLSKISRYPLNQKTCTGARRSAAPPHWASHHQNHGPGSMARGAARKPGQGLYTHAHARTYAHTLTSTRTRAHITVAGAQSLFVLGLGRARRGWATGAISLRAVGTGMLIEWSRGRLVDKRLHLGAAPWPPRLRPKSQPTSPDTTAPPSQAGR